MVIPAATSNTRNGPSAALVAGLCVAAIAVQAAILFALGQPWTCTCGVVRFWTGDVTGGENSQQFADWYSFTHAMHGFLFYGLLRLVAPRMSFGARLCLAVGLEAGWEILENSPIIIERYRQTAIAQGYFGDTILNSIGDNFCMVAGFLLARRLPVWGSVLYLVGAEIVLAWMIKDNLTLNIINLFFPGAVTL